MEKGPRVAPGPFTSSVVEVPALAGGNPRRQTNASVPANRFAAVSSVALFSVPTSVTV